ncbi:hypothetical protein BGZ50_006976 [Haplosporangium sp. Z 11]|nr:hypothetical protein BGZ50_006976 [Haplosporangium sp. Z 11]
MTAHKFSRNPSLPTIPADFDALQVVPIPMVPDVLPEPEAMPQDQATALVDIVPDALDAPQVAPHNPTVVAT